MPPFGKKPVAVTSPTVAEVRAFDLAKASEFARGAGRRGGPVASEQKGLHVLALIADDQLVISSAILLELAAMNDRAAA